MFTYKELTTYHVKFQENVSKQEDALVVRFQAFSLMFKNANLSKKEQCAISLFLYYCPQFKANSEKFLSAFKGYVNAEKVSLRAKHFWLVLQKANPNLPADFSDFFQQANDIYSLLVNKCDEKSIDDIAMCVVNKTYSETVKGKTYQATFYGDDVFISLSHALQISKECLGWKFHVSLDKQSLSKGWDIVSAILAKKGVKNFKVLSPEDELTSDQAGKQITVYMFDSPHINAKAWKEIFTEIEMNLRNNKLQPDKVDGKYLVDRKIPGSRYITYRNDKYREGKQSTVRYISAKEARSMFPKEEKKWYNPSGEKDEYLDFKFEEQKQLVNQTTGSVSVQLGKS